MSWSCYICSSEENLKVLGKRHYCSKHYLSELYRVMDLETKQLKHRYDRKKRFKDFFTNMLLCLQTLFHLIINDDTKYKGGKRH